MQIPYQNAYAQLGRASSLYNIFNEDDNNIGNAGVLHLSKGIWINLRILFMSFRWANGDCLRVGGSLCLVRGNWRYIKTLSMGNNLTMQAGSI
jgi:hypothetical protein